MKHIAKYLLVIALTMIFLSPNAANAQQNRIAVDGTWRIILPSAPSEIEAFAATELQSYINKMAGWELAITRADNADATKAFIIGRHPLSAKFAATLKRDHADDPDAFALVAQGNTITMAGSSDTAAAYAVWEWLELLGVRWFFPTEKGEYVPQLQSIEVAATERYVAPGVQFRSIWPWAVGDQAKPEYFGATEQGMPAWQLHQLRLRSWSEYNAKSVRDRFRNLGWGHSYHYFLSADKYHDQHPEWFNQVGGKRLRTIPEGVQVCFTNVEAAHEFAQNIRVALNNSADGDPRRRIIWVSPNDARAWCECPECQKLVDKDGSATSMVFHFANLVAKDLQKDHPDVKLLCYAYLNHSTPPDRITQLEPAVTPILTYWSANDSFAVNNSKPALSEDNPKFLRAYEKWEKLSQQFGVYQYYGHYDIFSPWPMQTQMDHDLKILSKNPKFWGFSCEYHSNWGTQALGLYLLAKLGWDPTQNADALVRDYCEKAYGPAAEPMYRLFVAQQKATDAIPYLLGDQWEVPNILPENVVADGDKQIAAVEAVMDQMDEGTKWRAELAVRGWRMSAAIARAYTRFNRGGGLQDVKYMREQMQIVKDTLNSPWGPFMIDSSINLGKFQDSSPRFFVPLNALPAGEHTYADNMNMGGLTKFYGKVENLIPDDWGWWVDPGKTGSITLPVKAATGQELSKAKLRWRTLGPNPSFNYTLRVTTAKGTETFEGQPAVEKELEIPASLLPAREAVIEIKVTNSSGKRDRNLYGLNLNVSVE